MHPCLHNYMSPFFRDHYRVQEVESQLKLTYDTVRDFLRVKKEPSFMDSGGDCSGEALSKNEITVICFMGCALRPSVNT